MTNFKKSAHATCYGGTQMTRVNPFIKDLYHTRSSSTVNFLSKASKKLDPTPPFPSPEIGEKYYVEMAKAKAAGASPAKAKPAKVKKPKGKAKAKKPKAKVAKKAKSPKAPKPKTTKKAAS
ncbi:hypothetical protein Fcan01_16504 [Folsomia candida]|uniref:Uncharacterized protein n=1 Tax=Folsomia candida TaxID=158441 RepID=A0A226DVV7_FOLCA|nr:hypothetical protein Fcan01_16504 [Folsomia candida]